MLCAAGVSTVSGADPSHRRAGHAEGVMGKIKITAWLLILLLLLPAAAAAATDNTTAIREYEYINGIKCKKRQNVITYLFMGIDEYGEVHERADEDDIPGQCDVLLLFVIDQGADTAAVIPIDRNTVTDVHAISDYDGRDLGAFKMQIALAHTNGNGLEESCLVVTQAVSDLLLGVKIDKYAAVNMDAIGILNHSVGGVTVTLEDDFSELDPEMTVGAAVHLSDTQAEYFVRGRMQIGDGSNTGRMRRQKQYLEAIKPLFAEKYSADKSFPLDVAHSLSPYMVTDMTDKDFSYIAKALQQNTWLGSYEITGTEGIDKNGWITLTPSEESITDIVTTLFYRRMDA